MFEVFYIFNNFFLVLGFLGGGFFAKYFYSFYTFTGVIKQNIHAFSQVTMSFSNFTNYTHNNSDIKDNQNLHI